MVSSTSSAVSRRPARFALLAAVTLVLAVPAVTTLWLGPEAYQRRDFAGMPTGVATTLARSVADLASLVTVGALVSLLLLLPTRSTSRLELTRHHELRVARVASTWWLVASLALVVLESADANGLSLAVVLQSDPLLGFVPDTLYSRAWMVSAAGAVVVLASTWYAWRWTQLLVPLVAGLVASLAPVVVGSLLVGPNHDIGGDAGIVVTVVSALVLGPVLVRAVAEASGAEESPTASRRLVTGLAWGVPCVLLYELVVVWFMLAGTAPTASLTGWLSAVRVVVLLVVGVLAWSWRRGGVEGVGASWGLPLLVVLVGAWTAAQVAMTRRLSPQYFVDTSISQIFFGFDVDAAPTPWTLLTAWRPNLLLGSVALVLMTGYLVAVRRLHRQGVPWPIGRVLAWCAGCVSLVVVTSSGIGRYSGADFAVHMVMHMSLNMLVPLLLVLGGPVTLLLRALPVSRPPAAREWIVAATQSRAARLVYHPLLVVVVFVGSYYGLYMTGLFEEMMRNHWAHQLMNVHFIVIGYLYYGLLVGVDRVPYQLPHIARLGLVFVAMPFHAFFGVVLMTYSTLIAATFYGYLDLPWMDDLLATQQLGGGIAWAGGEIPLLIVVVALVAQWARSDARDARRTDRHLDRGRDDDFDAYNEMLRALGERDRAAAGREGDRR